ncbi:putative CAMK/CDPK protein kinase [Blattamonas nauphoetae]|uniref:non-specific serine/threonine protein kinase n=1 Tax=Blattamonas nauphoetae TaxID=2049346 RepID=A0ABQ9XR67_9EUKA|nr:putative CAMK/CDPK protein kinase [Blattamonas nauphoetae]
MGRSKPTLHIQTESLTSRIKRFERGDDDLSWTRLMEWFVEAVMGAELFRKERPSAPLLTFEHIRIDASSTIIIAFPSSPQQPSISGSLSSDISTLCQFFLHIHRTLKQYNRLILPLDPEQDDIVFANIMVALVEHFVASGDFILPNSSPADHLQYFAKRYREINRTRISSIKQVRNAVKKVKETHSMEKVQNSYFDWKEWVTMMETIEKDVTRETDLSFLQSRCLRATLLSLQTKHQLRAHPPQTEEKNQADSDPFWMPSAPSLVSSALPTLTKLPSTLLPSLDDQVSWTRRSSLTSSISTQTSLPSSQWSSNSQLLTSKQAYFHSDSVARHSHLIILAIHDILPRPHPTSFSWNIRPSFTPESELDAYVQPSPQFFDQSERFDNSLFDETDDWKVVASLRRCHAVLDATQSTKCIANVGSFRSFLISGLHSSNPVIQLECYNMFFDIGTILGIADDPREHRFECLRMAFRDGTDWEKMTLLKLWTRWLNFQALSGNGEMMNKKDFDFDGFLEADMSDIQLFDSACLFLAKFFLNGVVSMSLKWVLDLIHSFEKKHQMMNYLSLDPSSFSGNIRPEFSRSPLAPFLGSLLSVLRGCDFPPVLTELLATDLDSSSFMHSYGVGPVFYLSYTSIDPKHRHSFFPMDLMFERALRDDPNAFFEGWVDQSNCTSRKFLFTPSVGLHFLLHQYPKLTLDQQALEHLIRMLFVDISNQDITQVEIHELFGSFPPPRLFDTLLSSPHLVRESFIAWSYCLSCFVSFGVLTAPFGACSSLAKVFKLLAPFDWNPNQVELNLLRRVGEIVVSLHWLSIPSHFDSPLLCHLPSLAGAQRGVLQTLSSHSGIPSLVQPNTFNSFEKNVNTMMFEEILINIKIHLLSQSLCNLNPYYFRFDTSGPFNFSVLLAYLHSRIPAIVSATVEFFCRFVTITSDPIRLLLVRNGLLDRVMFAVSNSSFLDDYEKGLRVEEHRTSILFFHKTSVFEIDREEAEAHLPLMRLINMSKPVKVPDGYTFMRSISSGGFGSVVELMKNSSQKHYAGKMIPCMTSKDEERIDREVNRLRKFTHPGIVGLKEVSSMDNIKVIVMELGGQSLADMVRDHTSRGVLVARDVVYRVMADISSALSLMHNDSSGATAHGDVKMENILLFPGGHFKLCDLGAVESEDVSSTRSVMSQLYVSPERMESETGRATCSSDVWALGIVLHWLLFGEPPFKSQNAARLFREIGSFRVSMIGSSCGGEERALLMRMLDPNPETRVTSRQLCSFGVFRCLVNTLSALWRLKDADDKENSDKLKNAARLETELVLTRERGNEALIQEQEKHMRTQQLLREEEQAHQDEILKVQLLEKEKATMLVTLLRAGIAVPISVIFPDASPFDS